MAKELMLDKDALPRHIGIIMDGNGRWAKKRGMPRTFGHREGVKAFERTIDHARDIGIECVTFYAFSTENWKRPKSEVDSIMSLFEKHLDRIRTMSHKNTRFIFIGDRTPLSDSIKRKMLETEEVSCKNDGLTVCIAINYGGRAEILNAAKNLCKSAADIDTLTEDDFASFLYTSGLPEVDLIIRPSGEQRISNFLIWQSAYAELVFMDVLWPDFDRDDLVEALNIYGERSRRFGGI